MKKFFAGILVVSFLVSCQKDEIAQVVPVVTTPAVFKDANIFVSNVNLAKKSNNEISVSFNTQFETDIVKIEVYHGSNKNTLCTFHEEMIAGNSTSIKKYSVVDKEPMGVTNYYMIKYTTKSGSWGFSPLYVI